MTVAVAAIVKEPLWLTLRFVAWYLHLGADRIDLYFDDPQDPAIEVLRGMERVGCHPCEAEFWVSLGLTPETRFTLRQNFAMFHAYERAKTDWLLVVDGDELLHLEGRSLVEIAGTFDDVIKGVLFPTAEVVRSDLGGLVARLPVTFSHIREIYDPVSANLLKKSVGLVGHALGKSMTRTGLKLKGLRQHYAVGENDKSITDQTIGPDASTALLHFPDTGYINWRRKLDWRSKGWGYSRRLSLAFAEHLSRGIVHAIPSSNSAPPTGNEAAIRDLYDKLHFLSADQVAKLKAAGACLHLDLNPDDITRHYFPGHLPPA